MKRTLLAAPLCALFLLAAATTANAQATGITVSGAFDSLNTYCAVPATGDMYVYGNLTGTPPITGTVSMYINYGDGTDTTFTVSMTQPPYFWANVPHTYQITGTFTPMVVASILGTNISDTVYANPSTITNNCAPVSGKLYVDANNNCVFDAGDIALPNNGVVLTDAANNSFWAASDANGNYQTAVPPGTYTVASNGYFNTLLSPSCPAAGSATLVVAAGGSYTQNFAFSCTPNGGNLDAYVDGWAWTWRPGFTRPLSILANSNNVCTTVPATITATLPTGLSYAGVFPNSPAPTVSGNTLTWNVASLGSLSPFFCFLEILADPSLTLGDTLCITLNVTTNPADANATNNTYDICAIVSNSYDPNDKAVSPKGEGLPGNILPGTPRLTYLVRFQNTGNDVAYNVTIADTLDADLNLSSLKVIRASHTMTPQVVNGNVLKFRFNNINLPDSGTNEPASHGYVLYAIAPKTALSMGTQITNTAHIYFDYNPAIVTNTTLNTIWTSLSTQQVTGGSLTAAIYPNPADGSIYVATRDAQNFKAQLFDMLGRPVANATTQQGIAIVPVHNLSNGTYLLRITTSDQKTISSTVNVQH